MECRASPLRRMASAGIGLLLAGCAGGPIAHWKFDECLGMRAIDSVGSHHGTLSREVTYIDDTHAWRLPSAAIPEAGGARSAIAENVSALRFYGFTEPLPVAQGMVRVPRHRALEPDTFCISAWIRVDDGKQDAPQGYVLVKHLHALTGDSGGGGSYALQYVSGHAKSGLVFRVRATGEGTGNPMPESLSSPPAQLTHDSWHFVTGLFDGRRARLFVDDKEVLDSGKAAPDGKTALPSKSYRIAYPVDNATGAPPYFRGDLSIGYFGTDPFVGANQRAYAWRGAIDDVRIVDLGGRGDFDAWPQQCRRGQLVPQPREPRRCDDPAQRNVRSRAGASPAAAAAPPTLP
jgi:hypothetical protein